MAPLFSEDLDLQTAHRLHARAFVLALASFPSAGAHIVYYYRDLEPNHTQRITLIVIAAYAVFIAIAWNVWGLRHLIYPFKLLTVAFHEFSHAAVGCCTCARIKSIELSPNEGGVTTMKGGIQSLTLPAGYLGSSFIGALLIFCGFDTTASKVASIMLGVAFVLTLWWARRDWLTIAVVLGAIGLIVAFWFIANAEPLRYLVLFIGTMSALYSLFDISDDLIFRKVNESDASVFAKRYGGSSICWGLIWFIISFAFLAAGIVAGLAVFKNSFAEQRQSNKDFLPTR